MENVEKKGILKNKVSKPIDKWKKWVYNVPRKDGALG